MAHLHIRDTVLSERRLPLPGRVVVLGRSLDVDVPLPHRSVSRRHALVESGGSGFHLSDLGSANGTFLGDRRLESGERVALPLNTPFCLGELVLRLVPDEEIGDGEEGEAAPAVAPAAPAASSPHVPAAKAPSSRPVVPSTARRTDDRPKPKKKSPRVRAANYRERRKAMRWFAAIVTVALLAVAGIFLVKILEGQEEAAPKGASETRDEPERKTREIKPLKVPADRD